MKPSPNAVDQDDLISSDVSSPEPVPKKDAPLHCERCGYNWHAQAGLPLQCSYCHSTYYTRPLKLEPAAAAEHQRLARERAGRRRIREAKQARIKRLRRVAKRLGSESVKILRDMFAEEMFDKAQAMVSAPVPQEEKRHEVKLPPPRFLPPPPKFEDTE